MKEPVYLDYNATTPLDREVIRAMEPFLAEVYGNPSSLHTQGVKARIAVENARRQVAAMLKCRPDEIIFTSGGTESNNLAIKGAAFSMRERGNHIITSEIEHPSVIEVCRYLEKEGFEVTYLPVDAWGMIDTARLRKEIRKSTILLTIMHANNETGTIQPVEEIGRIAGEAGILFHTDAAQSCGKIPVHADKIKADLISVAGHKLYAPKGTGALFVRRGVTLEKMMHGADHEQNLRAGTENVMSIAGLGKACERVSQKLPAYSRKMKEMRDQLHAGLKKSIPVQLNGHPVKRLPNTLNVSFPGADAQLMLSRMEGVAASAGAACHSGADITSPVLQAMKLTPEAMMGAIRFSVGRMTTGEDIRAAIKNITETYDALFRNQGNPSSPTPGKKEGIRLTSYTHSLGCACKIRPQLLEDLVKDLPVISRPEILVDMRTSDDAAAYLINPATALLQTVDFIPPVVDDPYDYGMIAAANALSDIYAMGGKPLFALSVVGFPVNLLPPEVLRTILKGAADKVAEAGISILGGHSVEETEPKFGLVVTGIVHPDKILRNTGARPGDALVITKPIGTGILTTAMKKGILTRSAEKKITGIMAGLNKRSAEILSGYPVHACTDITGFGLLGHLKEMMTGSRTGAVIGFSNIPVIPGVSEALSAGAVPGGTRNNLAYVTGMTRFEQGITEAGKLILADAQTSGGLLVSVDARKAGKLVQELRKAGIREAAVIGKVTKEEGKIRVLKEITEP